MALRIFLLVSGTSVLGSILWLVMRWPPGYFGHVAGAAMILSGAAASAAPLARAAGNRRALVAALGACLIGGASEIAGLYGDAFGAYIYTDKWQPTVHLPSGHVFPVLLPLMWFIILAACYSYARQRLSGLAAVATGAGIAAAADMVAEPLLTGPMGFWIWLEPTPLLGAPFLNAVGWFITTFIGCSWLAVTTSGRQPIGKEPAWMLIGALIATAIVGTTHGESRSLWALVFAVLLMSWRASQPPQQARGEAATRRQN